MKLIKIRNRTILKVKRLGIICLMNKERLSVNT